jgi:hypothetical protein
MVTGANPRAGADYALVMAVIEATSDVTLAINVAQFRETTRLSLGDRYDAELVWWRGLIRKAMEHWKCGPMVAVTKLETHNRGTPKAFEGASIIRLLVAAADVAERKDVRRRADGWPLCPGCGEDELWSSFTPPNADPIPDAERLRLYLGGAIACYRCAFTAEPDALLPLETAQ